MAKKEDKNNQKKQVEKKEEKKSEHLAPIYRGKLTFGQKAADVLTKWAGSWTFILLFIFFLILWMVVNTTWMILGRAWDPKPFILLNLVLSCLAALQAPIILMTQNRQAQRDRTRFEYDYQVNRKTEREVKEILKDVRRIKKHIYGEDVKK